MDTGIIELVVKVAAYVPPEVGWSINVEFYWVIFVG